VRTDSSAGIPVRFAAVNLTSIDFPGQNTRQFLGHMPALERPSHNMSASILAPLDSEDLRRRGLFVPGPTKYWHRLHKRRLNRHSDEEHRDIPLEVALGSPGSDDAFVDVPTTLISPRVSSTLDFPTRRQLSFGVDGPTGRPQGPSARRIRMTDRLSSTSSASSRAAATPGRRMTTRPGERVWPHLASGDLLRMQSWILRSDI